MSGTFSSRARTSWRAYFVTATAGALVAIVLIALVVPRSFGMITSAASYDVEVPELQPLARRSLVLDRDGGVLATLYSEDREPVDLGDVSPWLIDAVIAAEDRDFYEHDGFDVQGTARALVRNFRAGSVEEGGSTITQQLVKNTLIDEPDRTIARKMREAVLARRIEERYSKQEILERYLNTIYFGNGAYGVRAAAERYFATTADQLDVAQSAMLAALIASPGGRDPIENPDAARAARNTVIAGMAEMGVLSAAQVTWSQNVPLPTTITEPAREKTGSYFVEEVRRQLLADERLGATRGERERMIYEGGLRIHTTFDPQLQAYAEQAVRENAPAGEFVPAFVVLDNATGAVLAMVSGRDFDTLQYDLVTQGVRQPGSTFKAVTFAAAMANGFSPLDQVDGRAPCTFDMGEYAEPWNVSNYDGGTGGGTVTLEQGLAQSMNCAFARTVMAVGPDKVADIAQRMGVRRELEAVPSITLGSQGVSPLEMATIFSTLASDGLRHDPVFVTRVEDADGEAVFETRTDGEQVIDPEVARTTTMALQAVVQRGTGAAADIGRPVAGKTGTSQAHRDAWFVGYTPQLTAAAWMGHPAAQVEMLDVGGIRVTGGSYPARIWAAFMRLALADEPVLDFLAPDPTAWPAPTRITEAGRFVAPVRPPRAPSTTPDTTVAPTTTPPTTAPPREPKPPKPPKTTTTTAPPPPPTTVPPPPPTTVAPAETVAS
ncbi:MAG TPA: PBP1A family penicillin-binding protein [Acidimicrobiia bacterium]|nr:PBP1A family penicillin-binding protein [Acidimicrobiia bacterium]